MNKSQLFIATALIAPFAITNFHFLGEAHAQSLATGNSSSAITKQNDITSNANGSLIQKENTIKTAPSQNPLSAQGGNIPLATGPHEQKPEGISGNVTSDPKTSSPQDNSEVGLPEVSDPFKTHMTNLPPALRILQANGVKMTSLGNEGGLQGYLLEEDSGRMQVVYLTPDGKSMVIGVMQTISTDGKRFENVTMFQFAALKDRFEKARQAIEEQKKAADDARKRADAATKTLLDQQQNIGEASKQFSGTLDSQQKSQPKAEEGASLGANTDKKIETASNESTIEQTVPKPAAIAVTPSLPQHGITEPQPDHSGQEHNSKGGDSASAMSVPVAIVHENAPPPIEPAIPAQAASRYIVNVDKTKLLDSLEQTAYFPVGKEGLPTLYIVADPQCPHCHLAWKRIKPLVASGKISVKVLLIGALPGSDRVALNLISQENPGRSWWFGQGSEEGHQVEQGAPIGSPAARQGQKYLDINMEFVKSHNITGTPWMAYVGKNGMVYETFGDQNIDDFLAGM